MRRRVRSAQQAPGRPREPAKDASIPHHGDSPSTPQHPIGATPAAASDSQCPDDNDHQEGPRRKWDRSEKINALAAAGQIASALFAVFVVIVSLQQAHEARRQADIAQEALIAAERPWIKVVGLSDVSVRVEDPLITIFAKINVSNIGQSPAPETFVKTRVLANGSIDDTVQAATILCKDFIAGRYIGVTYELVFPGEDRILWDVAAIERHTIIRDNERRIQEQFQSNRSTYGDQKAEEYRAQAAAAPPVADFHLIGCVNYKIPIGDVVGQTAFCLRHQPSL